MAVAVGTSFLARLQQKYIPKKIKAAASGIIIYSIISNESGRVGESSKKTCFNG